MTEPLMDIWTKKLLQEALKSRSLYTGSIDGIWGSKSALALDAYKRGELTKPLAVAPVKEAIPNYTQFENRLRPGQESDLVNFKKNWDTNYEWYAAVAIRAQIPAVLVAALHWRESTGNFHAYLHQGDKLGKPAINVPKNIPVFPDTRQGWLDAAVHALQMKEALRVRLGITASTIDLNALCAFSEHYNGLGYRNHVMPSPYVLSGTTGYEKGKYVADGKLDRNAVDKQLGTLLMMRVANKGIS